MEPYLLDCDTGIDDALALLHLLADPAADLIAVTNATGNVSAAQAARNTLGLLHLAGRDDIPVSEGAPDPLARSFDGGATQVHGADGVGGVALPDPGRGVSGEEAANTIVRLAREHQGRLRLVATAPLTNLALALRREPRLPELVASLTVMGGAAQVPGNLTPAAEANIYNDPEAAAEVLAAGFHLLLVPLDVTMEHVLEEPDRQRLLEAGHPVLRAAGEMLAGYFDFYRAVFGRPCSALHDPLAAALATGSVRATLAPAVPVVVDTTDGPGRGATIADLRNRYRGYPDVPGARTRVVLNVGEPFGPVLTDRLLAFFG